MVIKKIARNKLYLSTEEIMDISPFLRQKYRLKVNDDISSLYDNISYEAALEKGIFLISLKDRTKKELYKKLEEKYQNNNAIKKAIKKLEELGYLNDLDYSISYIKNKKYGKNRIIYNLTQKGIEKKIVELAYEELETEGSIDDKRLENLIKKNEKKLVYKNSDLKKDEYLKQLKEEQKFIQFLARQGFSLDKIFEKIKEYKSDF
ncbi:regulatory protein RecX [Leptotrichia sp. oral taxon 847]|uniref:regulatory protein RecX n=1 Tax=Leptotrichia sp. oral taxon 847 TaxID=1785996 RepID=UPI0007680D29|nr:regulatory protein RecX [Leptotrichia sp. oral taxon 847]AMD95463.1 RecX family transcriptional regulator [Leptotrichia sp. oral taxon 847]